MQNYKKFYVSFIGVIFFFEKKKQYLLKLVKCRKTIKNFHEIHKYCHNIFMKFPERKWQLGKKHK